MSARMNRIISSFVFFLLVSAVLAEDTRCYELRIYTAAEGKLEALNTRFRDHTCKLFEKHGLTNVGYWVPQDTPNTLIYIIAHDSRDAARENWGAFREDPDWPGIAQASGVGRVQVESVFMDATDYSPMK